MCHGACSHGCLHVSLVVIVYDAFVCFTLIACVFVFVFLSASVFAGLLYVFVNVLA